MQPAEIVFTSGGTESDNLAIFGAVAAARCQRGPVAKLHVITTQVEHHAVLHSCQELQRQGVEVTFLPVSADAIVNPDDIRRSLRPETVLLSIMHANNELGAIQPLSEISRIAAEAGVPFHTDAVQSVGKLPVNVGPAPKTFRGLPASARPRSLPCSARCLMPRALERCEIASSGNCSPAFPIAG